MDYNQNYKLGNYGTRRYRPTVAHNIRAWKEMLFAAWVWPHYQSNGVPAWYLVRAVPNNHPTSTAKSYVRWLAKERYIVPFVGVKS